MGEKEARDRSMKQNKNDYVTIGADGTMLVRGASKPASEPAGETADIAYRLPRLAAEAMAGMTSAHAGNAPARAEIDPASASGGESDSEGEDIADHVEDARPVALVLAHGKTAKRLLQDVSDAGFAACAVYTKDRRLDPYLRFARDTVCLGDVYSDALFGNGYAVLNAAEASGATVILLSDEALPLAEVDSFLARATARGLLVFRTMSSEAPTLGWIPCTTDKVLEEGDDDEESWRRCPHCGLTFDRRSVIAGRCICPSCGGYMRMSSTERINDLLDSGSFVEWNRTMPEVDPLGFPGYREKLAEQHERTGLQEAVRTGEGRIAGLHAAIAFMDSQFFMGSMGSIVGEKITRMIERATDERLPVVIFTASGGARMQEGLLSLMQMAKVSCALSRHGQAGLPYVAVLTDPTTGGVTASFAMQGDIILAEPGALVGFAGQRVIRDTIRQELPDGFQTAEFALQHGLIDAIVPRDQLRDRLAHILAIHLSTAEQSAVGPGTREILVDYGKVCENLERGTDTYNSVTFGVLEPVRPPLSETAGWGTHVLKRRLSAFVEQVDRRRNAASLRRLQNAMRGGQFDSEVDGSLAGSPDEVVVEGPNRAWESVQLARNTHRPTAHAYIDAFVDGFMELHGDRMFGDDGAVVCGIGWIGGRAVTVVSQEKGADLSERIERNFGCPQPEGYRKSLRIMRQAEKFNRPIVCLVDTQGAFCGMEAEERGQGNAIADNLIALAGLRVPVVSVLVGEGGSGGALAFAVADRVAMQEHAVYSVLSPEGFASILWKDRTRAPEAASVMKMSAHEACSLGVVDDVLSEGPAPAHENPQVAARNIRDYLVTTLDELCDVPLDKLLKARYERFGRF